MRYSSGYRATQGIHPIVYSIPAVCTITDGSESYGNTGPIEWSGWLGKYRHIGMRPPEFYYPNGPYNVNGTPVTETTGCRAIGVTGFTTYSTSGGAQGSLNTGSLSGEYTGSQCLIIFGGNAGVSSVPSATVNSNLGSFRELQRIPKNSGAIQFNAYPAPGPCTTTTSGIFSSAWGMRYDCNDCCDIKYMIISGEFPPDLTLDMETGEAYGLVSEMDLPDDPEDKSGKDYFMERWRLPPNYKITEKNYATVGSASGFWNGRPASNTARFVIRAFNARDPRVFNDREFTMTITNNWSSDRDRLILNIDNQFFIDGKPTTNKDYLLKMKDRGYLD